jgi:hypothetical protein
MATPRAAGGSVWMGLPPSVIVPLVTSSKPAIMRSVEVLPQPDEPSNATISPGAP